MSEFSELLSFLVKSRDINVSALTSYCGLDRSTMYKLINGKRNPASKDQVRKMSEFMNLNPLESQELMEAYHITRIGWEIYYRRKNVSEFILNFQEIQSKTSPNLTPSLTKGQPALPEKGTVPLSSRLQVTSSIHKILLQASLEEAEKIYIVSQPEHLESLDIAASLLRSRSSMEIFHIICINNSKSFVRSQQDYNLQCLTKLIPFFGTQCVYHSYYYYDNVNSHFNNLNFMPCVFLTQKAAVVCSGDLKDGILFHSQDLVSLLSNRFQALRKETSPLILSFRSSLEFHLRDFPAAMAGSRDAYALSTEPCLMPFISEEMLTKYLSKDFPAKAELVPSYRKYAQTFSGFTLHNYFTSDGVRQFLRTGRVHEIPEKLYRPFEYPDRVRLIKQCLKMLKDGKDFRLFRPPLDKFPENLHLFTSGDFGYILFSDRENLLNYLLLKEQNILNAFYDFSSNLEKSDLLCSPDETAAFLQNLTELA